MKYNNTGDIMKILGEAPAARKALLDNHSNLNMVADYCENKYSNTEDPTKAVEESKALTTQALASVVYQINTLAASVLRLLDTQTVQLKEMESSVNILSMTVDMYKEKVARQEIGVLTAPCKIPCVQMMVPPAKLEDPNVEYERVPISYTSLDSIGHGVWDSTKMVSKKPEPQTTIQQSSSQDGGPHFGSGIAVPPPSVPNWFGLKTPASSSTPVTLVSSMSQPESFYEDTPPPPPPPPPHSSDSDGLSPPPPIFSRNSLISVSTPSPSPFSSAFRDSFLPPPPPQTEFMAPPPPPSPPSFGGSFPPTIPPEYVSMAPPPFPFPPHNTGKGHVAPPPPLRSIPGGGSAPLPPPPPGQNIAPPPPPPMSPGKAFIPPPPPPPPGQSIVPPPPPSMSPVKAFIPFPPPPPPEQSIAPPPPPPPASQGKAFIPPPPPLPADPGKSFIPPPPPPPAAPGKSFIPPPPPPPPF